MYAAAVFASGTSDRVGRGRRGSAQPGHRPSCETAGGGVRIRRVAWPIVDRVPLGRSGIEVSAVMVGGGTIGGIGSARATWGKGLTDEEAFHMLDTAVGIGIGVIDTANSYAGGHSEEVIGSWLRSRSADVLVATKVGNLVEADQADICLANDHIVRQFPASLRRLGLDKIDLYLSHAPDASTPIGET